MSSLDDSLKKITILEVLIVILALYGVLILLRIFYFPLSEDWMYLGLIIYFVYRLRFFREEFKKDLSNIFLKMTPKSVVTIVLVNVFFSYGMLYLSNFALDYIPGLSAVVASSVFPLVAINSLVPIGGLISSIIISPISEELLFRGVFLNRLKLIVPTSFAIAITSILFGALHSYGNIISAIVFGVCMCIIYLKTRNVLTCIFAHFLNNLLAETLYYADYGNLIFTNDIFIVVFSVLAIVSLYLIATSVRKEWRYINKR